MAKQADGTVSSPPVILEEGIAGTSTIYTNKTSAKVNVAAPVWLSGWDKRIRIEIDSGDVDSGLSSFPVLIHLSNSSSGIYDEDVSCVFDEVGSNSKKIALTVGATAETYVEVEHWYASAEQAWLWANVTASASSNTTLYLYYDNDHADNPKVGAPNSTAAENVWDSNFKFVSHMRDDPDSQSIRDSTSNNNDGNKTGAAGGPTFTTDGHIDGAQDFFDGNNDTVECDDDASLDITDTITIEAWVKPTISALREMFMKGSAYYNEAYEFFQNYQKIRWRLNNNAIVLTSNNSLTIGAWNHIVATYDKNLASNNMKVFIAGVQDPTTANYTTAINTNDHPFVIGAYPYPDSYGNRYPFKGYIDEVRVSNVARSAAWIKASYESGRDHLLDYGSQETVWLSGWDKRIKITIDNNDVDNALSNFPVLVYLSSSSGRNNDDVSFVFDELQSDANRKKIAVTTSDGTTQCYVEIEKWDNVTEQAWLWVKVPSISNTTDTDLYLYYDADHADNTDYVGDPDSTLAEKVWDSDFRLVTHMRDDPDTSHVRDSTTNDNDGTKMAANEPVEADGKVGEGQNYDGVNDTVWMANNSSLNFGTGDFTLEVWVNTSATAKSYIIDKYNGYDIGYQLVMNANGTVYFEVRGGTLLQITSTATINDGSWHYIVGVADRDSSMDLYFDVVNVATGGTNSDNVTNSDLLILGANQWQDADPSQWEDWFGGYMDEVRISGTTRSFAWIKASYESERDDLLDFGSEESASGTYDYVLKVVNQVADNWAVNLQVYDNSSINRLSSLNISLHDGTTSDQIIVSGGSITQSEGALYNLAGNATIYMNMSNLQASTSGISHLYVYLKILVPDTSTYAKYITTFEIT